MRYAGDASGSAIDVERLASEWLRAARGQRTQAALSRRLGYQSNIVYRWESGRCFPTATIALRLLQHCRIDVRTSLSAFYGTVPPWLGAVEPVSRAGVARLLADLRGQATLVELAAKSGHSRLSIARWLKGTAEPTLPELLTLIESVSLRALDFVACFVDPDSLPSVRERWRTLSAARRAAYEEPWSHAVLRALELEPYRALERHRAGWIAARLGIEPALEQSSVELLVRAGQVRWTGTHYAPASSGLVDTRADAERARGLRAWWTEVNLLRLRQGAPGVFAYNLSAVSRRDLERIEALQRAHYREIVRIVSESSPAECVLLYTAQLAELTGDEQRR
jgi:hypothetical protein